MAARIWRRHTRLLTGVGLPGDIEPGSYVRAAWGLKGYVVSIAGDAALVCTRPGHREIVEARYLRRISPDPAAAWLDMREARNDAP